MQRTLSITEDKKKIVSKPFDFEAMCLINEKHNDMGVKGPLKCCKEAVEYLFEGSEATQKVIDGLDVSVMSRLCLEVWKWYLEVWKEIEKND